MSRNKLEEIAADVRRRIDADRSVTSEEALEAAITHTPKLFRETFREPDSLPVIAEIKRASPSDGAIASGADPVATATTYLTHGAAACSVLTERDHFNGDPAFLKRIREAHPNAYLLMKDFFIDDYQLLQARALGADAVLLIVALLGRSETERMLEKAQTLGLSCLVEVHDRSEMQVALDVGANLIGVNNRDLRTLNIDLRTSEALATMALPSTTLISESGLRHHDDLVHLRKFGYSGFLVGTSLMKTGDPGKALQRLRLGNGS